MTHSKSDIQALFANDQGYSLCRRTQRNRPTHIINLEQALLTVYSLQTADEQSSETTTHSNGQGFSGSDASFGSSLAKQVLAGRWLTRKQLAALGKMLPRYWAQLGSMVATIKVDSMVLNAYPEGDEDDWA